MRASGELLQVKSRALPYPGVGSDKTGKIAPGPYDKMVVVLFNPGGPQRGDGIRADPR